MNFFKSQGLLLCWRQTYEQNPAKSSTLRTPLPVARAAASRPWHGRTGLPETSWPEKKVRHFRFDWKCEEPPRNMHDVRAAAAPLSLKLKLTTLFSWWFFGGKHVNLLELGSLISLLRRITREGIRGKAALGTCEFARGLGSRVKGTLELTKINFLLRKLGFWCLAHDGALELMWLPIWANLADALTRASRSRVGMPHCQSFLRHRPHSLHQPTLSRSWIYSVNHCRLLPIQRENMCVSLNPPVSSVDRKRNLPVWRRRTSQVTNAGESMSTPSNVRQLHRKCVKSVSSQP